MTEAIEIIRTKEELLAYAEELSQKVWGVGAYEAWERVKKGEAGGSAFDSKMRQLFFLLEDDYEPEANERGEG